MEEKLKETEEDLPTMIVEVEEEDDDYIEHLLENYKYKNVIDFLKYNFDDFFEDGDFEVYFKFKDKIYLLSFCKKYDADDVCVEVVESWDKFEKIKEGKYKLNKFNFKDL